LDACPQHKRAHLKLQWPSGLQGGNQHCARRKHEHRICFEPCRQRCSFEQRTQIPHAHDGAANQSFLRRLIMIFRALDLPNNPDRPSPSRLIPKTRKRSANPGIFTNQGSKTTKSLASAIMRPQEAMGGLMPRPRKERAASSMTAWAISRVVTVISGITRQGSMSAIRMLKFEQPAARAAWTNSRSLNWMTNERLTIAY